MLKEEPHSSKYSSNQYQTKPGKAKLEPDMANLIPNGDIEMQKSQFYDENKYWLMDEVDKYMSLNQR